MVDEANTEAVFVVTELLLAEDTENGRSFDAIMAKYPEDEARFRFYRMYTGYALKAYFAYRALSSLAYLKKKGVLTAQVQLEDEYVPRSDDCALMRQILDEAAKTPMEKAVLEFYMLGNTYEVIGEKVGLKPKRVRRVINRIKRRLRTEEVQSSEQFIYWRSDMSKWRVIVPDCGDRPRANLGNFDDLAEAIKARDAYLELYCDNVPATC